MIRPSGWLIQETTLVFEPNVLRLDEEEWLRGVDVVMRIVRLRLRGEIHRIQVIRTMMGDDGGFGHK